MNLSKDSKVNEKLVAMGQMAACLAHEIRNPLGSMELNIGLLRRIVGENDLATKYITEIQRSVKSLNNIVCNSLQFTKDISPKRQKLSSARIFIAEICNYVCQGKVDGESIETETLKLVWKEVGEETMYFDPFLIGQVLINLLTNAVHASEINHSSNNKGLVELLIDHTNSEYLSIKVLDDGEGIPENLHDQVFDPFFTTKEKGTGLGLAIVHSIVMAHSGIIEISSRPSGGTSFEIILNYK